MNLTPILDNPQGEWFPENAIPARCSFECIEGRVLTSAITIYWSHINGLVTTWDYEKGKPRTYVSVTSIAYRFFMDQYGCRIVGPPPRRDDPETVTWDGTGYPNEEVDRQTAWGFSIEKLKQGGALDPGTVELVGSGVPLAQKISGIASGTA